MIRKFLTFGEPTKATGRIYTKEQTRFPRHPAEVWITLGHMHPIPLTHIAGLVENIELREDGVYGVVKFYEHSPHGKIAGMLEKMGAEIEFQAGGLGYVDKDMKVTEFVMTHVAVEAKGLDYD